MSKDPIVFDSVSFVEMSDERLLQLSASHSIQDIAFVPLPGDRIQIEGEREFIVVYREFRFRSSTCAVTVFVQPATREK